MDKLWLLTTEGTQQSRLFGKGLASIVTSTALC